MIKFPPTLDSDDPAGIARSLVSAATVSLKRESNNCVSRFCFIVQTPRMTE